MLLIFRWCKSTQQAKEGMGQVEECSAMNIIPMTITKTNLLVPIIYALNFIHRNDNSLSHYQEW